jgi:hypothetical protein
MEIFQGWDQWKSAMMTLPEDAFFDLLRSVFGHVKTPFNKQNLLADLAAFLSRDDIRRNIAAYIDEADAQVIAAVGLLGNPTAAELEQFFAGDDLEIPALLLNLEERFILYRYREEAALRLGLNPVLEPVLAAVAGDLSRLFPSLLEEGEDRPGDQGDVPFDDRFFAALISFILDEGNLFKTEGRRPDNRLRKKVQDSGRRIFPGLELEPAIRGLLCLGLCRPASPGAAPAPEEPPVPAPAAASASAAGTEGEILRPDPYALRAFGDLEPRDRQIYWTAGLCLGADSGPEPLPAPPLLRGRIRALARLISAFLDFLSPGRLYPLRTLRRMFFFLERGADGFSTDYAMKVNVGTLCAALARAGLLRGTSQTVGQTVGQTAGQTAGPAYSLPVSVVTPGGPDAPVLVMDAPLFCLVHAGVDFLDALALASFTVIRETGRIFRFEITRESCLRGFERGLDAAGMGELLSRLSGNRLEASLLWTLRDWEKRSTEVSLFDGAVLALSPERCYLTEAEPLAALIRRELAPGLYLVDSGDRTAEALRKAGVDMFTRYGGQPDLQWGAATAIPAAAPTADGAAFTGANAAPLEETALDAGEEAPGLNTGRSHGPFPPLQKQRAAYQDAEGSAMMDMIAKAAGTSGEQPGGPAEALKARFHRVLKDRSLSGPERNELAARVERRLVLTDSQISSASVRGEKLEARDLDYVGKASIARHAISSRSLVEVLFPAAEGEQRILGVPLALEKSGGETILVIEPSTTRSPGDTFRIPLGKISLLRRIKKSMFEA